jgi:hypothetical protein
MIARTRFLPVVAALVAILATACSDSTSATPLTGPRASASDGGSAAVVNLNGHWNGQATWSFLGAQSFVSQLFLTEDATGNVTGVLTSFEKCDLRSETADVIIDCITMQTSLFTGTAKSDGTFSAKTAGVFGPFDSFERTSGDLSINGKVGTQVCADGSSATAINGTFGQSGKFGFGFQGSYSVNACLPAPVFILQHPSELP